MIRRTCFFSSKKPSKRFASYIKYSVRGKRVCVLQAHHNKLITLRNDIFPQTGRECVLQAHPTNLLPLSCLHLTALAAERRWIQRLHTHGIWDQGCYTPDWGMNQRHAGPVSAPIARSSQNSYSLESWTSATAAVIRWGSREDLHVAISDLNSKAHQRKRLIKLLS